MGGEINFVFAAKWGARARFYYRVNFLSGFYLFGKLNFSIFLFNEGIFENLYAKFAWEFS